MYEYDYYYYPLYYRPTMMQSLKYSFNCKNISKALETTQKTLYTVNQIIPTINQVRPIIANAKTALRVANAVKEM
ncbi:MAG: hypothetical protein LUF02_03380 [Erysipelotrichaceae bacterium]|nr:hypothetical protein [Erysipelotrichaceae bacterium]